MICKLIGNESINNQEQLSKRLSEMGFAVTQATLSRDIKQLKVIKVHDAKVFIQTLNSRGIWQLSKHVRVMRWG